MRRHAVTVALVILAAGLGIYAAVDRGKATDDDKERRETSLFPAWRRGEIKAFEIEIDGRKARFDRRPEDAGAGWRSADPDLEIDASVVDRTLAALEHARPLRRVTKGSPTGLGMPRARGTVSMGAISLRFAVGGPATTPEGATYFQIEGAEPVVVSRDLATELLKGTDLYRERSLATVPVREILEFAVEDLPHESGIASPAGGFAMARRGRGFVRVRPDGLRVSRSLVDRIWHGYADLRAESFLAERIDSPSSRVTVTPAHGEPLVLLVGRACKGPAQIAVERIGGGSRITACVPLGAVTAVPTDELELTDGRLFHARPDEVVDVTIDVGAFRMELARKGAGFRMRAPEARDLDPEEAEAATGWLARIFSAQARHVSTRPSQSTPKGRLVVHTESGDEVIEIHPDDRLRRQDDGAWLDTLDEMRATLAQRATITAPLRLFPRELERQPVTELRIACGGTHGAAALAGEPGASRGRWVTAADELLRLRADAWIAEDDDGRFGTRAGKCSVAFTTAGPSGAPASRRVLFGAILNRMQYARIEGDSRVFLVPEQSVQRFVAALGPDAGP